MIDVRICDPNEGGGPMTSESARDVLLDAMAKAQCDGTYGEGTWGALGAASRLEWIDDNRPSLDAALAHPVELLALLAEPKVEREAACVERWPECHDGDYDPRCCRFPKSCSCTSVVAVDVLDLLGYEQVGWESVREVCNHADSLLSLAAHRGVDDEWKMEAIALSLRFRGLAKQLQSPIYMAIP